MSGERQIGELADGLCELAGVERAGRKRMVGGRGVAVAMLALGVAAALFAGWFYFTLQRRPLEFWGTHVARQILRAPRVVAMEIEVDRAASDGAQDSGDETIVYGGDRYRVVRRREVSSAPGFTHVRHSLLNDAAFDWNTLPDAQEDMVYRYVLRFEGEGSPATLLLDAACRHVAVVETGRRAVVDPVAKPIGDFLREQFASPRSPAANAPERQVPE